ncbi:efflux RND transporter periplasmic adaptor subunit [Ferrimonas sp. SCSIO 43195]|uniref:efflux RND transporter periplasmic adaptor subunit n=1 Tax=Ferrimonas sp. SCSIO 43195 TaxID=2822844 RepID=UPI00207636C3|nr:HlyD family efflux transporter periplasmic adaptor subunit [Ferrimonas sp. SCSIO 43195]USD36531.1 HlyD family efflux transporter periplasmic adaptor subunit [Ferrimonas sp. SCSIO 43195]
MDRKITPSRGPAIKNAVIATLLGLVLASAAYALSHGDSDRVQQRVDSATLVVTTVQAGAFEDTLRLRGSIKPKTSIYLDAISGGRVEQKLVEQGEFVTEGQPLVKLSNSALQLDVISREAQITEQLNFLRNTQMTMETNKLNLKRDLLEIEHQINQLQRKVKQAIALEKRDLIPKDDLLNLQQDLSYYQKRRQLTQERQQAENLIRQAQITQLEDSAKMLDTNLAFARKNLDNLLVKAPVSGYLSDLDVVVGESKTKGARLGQIDLPGEYKLAVEVDEYYLSQVQLGMAAKVRVNGRLIDAITTKIDSRVNASRFTVEIDLPGDLAGIKRGQSLDVDLVLSSPQDNAVLLNKGAFVNDSGGHWAFVLSSDGHQAHRTAIRLGKKNATVFQVLEGLKPGDRVITSSYSSFDNADELLLN